MKKMYEELEMEVIRFNAEDVIVTSGDVECDVTAVRADAYTPDDDPSPAYRQ